MTSVASIEAQLGPDFDQQLKAAIFDTRTNTRVMSPTARLGWLGKALEELGLDTGYLSPARNLAARAADMKGRVFEQTQNATRNRGEAVRRLITDPTAPLDDAASVCAEVSPWLDAPAGQKPPAAQLVYEAGRAIEQRIDGQIASCGEQIYALLQRKAREVVAEVAQLPALPKTVWISAAPDEDLGRLPVHRGTWGILLATFRDFEAVHRIAEQIRDGIGAGPDSLPDGAPRDALVFRNWRLVLENSTEFNSVKKPLRLRYAIEHGFLPGLWRPGDIKTTAEDASPMTKLKRFGFAMFGGPSSGETPLT